MQITILAVGKIKEKYLQAGIAEFCKRLKPYCRLVISEIDEEKLPDNASTAQKQQALAKEGERLLKRIPDDEILYLLDLGGKPISSEELAVEMAMRALTGKSRIIFVIGGAFGLADEIRVRADERVSFSRLTLTHQMIRLLLVEQIYRAFKINRGEPYHY